MRGQILSAYALAGVVLAGTQAQARVFIKIDLSSQTMHVQSEEGSFAWPISTARSGYRTPRGSYRPYLLLRMHYSRKYHMSPMPYSIFFAGGYAIHGTYETRWLGRPASHGCVRLAPGNAALLFHMVQREGAAISITGSPPAYYAWARRRKTAIYAHVHAKPASMAWHHLHHPALAYAPSRRRAAPVKVWQANPVPKSVQWPAWPW